MAIARTQLEDGLYVESTNEGMLRIGPIDDGKSVSTIEFSPLHAIDLAAALVMHVKALERRGISRLRESSPSRRV